MGERARGDYTGERAVHTIYGSVVVLAVIVAARGSEVTAGEAIASVVGAAVVTALAEIYADYIGATIAARRHPTPRERETTIRNFAFGFLAAISPVVFFVLAAAGVIRLDVAFDIAVWTGVAVLGGYATVAHRLAGNSIGPSLAVGLFFSAIGAFLVALKGLV
ncbi:hypothetical protein HJD18_06080 [Thermoleophilia bacterium SCSIO 60948]|nr:hypothetical protein HJD18_06080 [Thermoleophilia bacterium SCSIO 60948]